MSHIYANFNTECIVWHGLEKVLYLLFYFVFVLVYFFNLQIIINVTVSLVYQFESIT